MTRRRPLRRAAAALAAAALTVTLAPLSNPGGASARADQVVARPFGGQLVRVSTPDAASKARLQRLGLDLTEHAGTGFVEVLLHTLSERAVLDASGLTYRVSEPDVARRFAEVNAADAAFAARTSRSRLPSGRTSYRTLADYEADLRALAARHPRLAKVITLKRASVDGRTTYGIEIGSDVRKPPSGRPTFVMLGLHHAREWPSGENSMEFAVDLVTSYGSNDRISRLLRQARVIVVPVVNVDGFDLSRTDGAVLDLRGFNALDPTGLLSVLATPGQAYKRKNCTVDGLPLPDGSCRLTAASPGGFGIGVDLNRNYAGFWGGPGASGPLPDAAEVEAGVLDPTYRGAAPFSEPETKNVRDLVASRQTTMLITNHTSGNLILRPNGVNPKTIGPGGKPVGNAPDEAGLDALGASMARQNGYANQHGWQLYDTTGTTEDWSYNATGGYGYTFEIGPDEFHPPFEDVVDQYRGSGRYAGRGNRAAYLLALEHTVSTRANGVLRGKAPRGAVLRLSKTFRTPTWSGSYADGVSSRLVVPSSGSFRWVVNPSTRPLVAQAGGREKYTLTCSRGGKVRLRTTVYVDRGQDKRLDLRRCR